MRADYYFILIVLLFIVPAIQSFHVKFNKSSNYCHYYIKQFQRNTSCHHQLNKTKLLHTRNQELKAENKKLLETIEEASNPTSTEHTKQDQVEVLHWNVYVGPTMKDDAKTFARRAMNRYKDNTERATYMKTKFDNKYPNYVWSSIVGPHAGSDLFYPHLHHHLALNVLNQDSMYISLFSIKISDLILDTLT